jgi:hypothetical protein
MRIFLLFFPVFFFCGLLHAQTVKVEYGGDPLPDKDRKKIEQFLQHEVDFYSQFGLPDTLSSCCGLVVLQAIPLRVA